MPLWTIPELWPGSTVFIIGGGPSLLQQDLTPIHTQRVIGVNHAFSLGPWVDICWYGDKEWGYTNAKKLREYGGIIATCSAATEQNRFPNIKYVNRSKQYGIEYVKRTHVAWNSNSGASAISLAYWLGAKRVILLGFDMKNPADVKDNTHWHNEYEKRFQKPGKLTDPYPRFMKGWPYIVKDAARIGLEIINCTPDSALTIIPYKPFEEICREISVSM